MSLKAEHRKAIEIFYSYAHEDELLRKELDQHLSNLKRQGFISSWHDRDINAGTDWEQETSEHLNKAQIILLLISPAFMASDYCYHNEMKLALKRHETKDARVIPVILRPVHWKGSLFGKLSPLPKDGEPVTRWPDRDEAFLNVAEGIQRVVIEYWLEQGREHFGADRFEEAIAAYEMSIRLDPENSLVYFYKGLAFETQARQTYAKAQQLGYNAESSADHSLLSEQLNVQRLEQELALVRRQHNKIVDELYRAKQELEKQLRQVSQERKLLRDKLQNVIRQNSVLSDDLDKATAERDRLQARNQQWSAYCDKLEDELKNFH